MRKKNPEIEHFILKNVEGNETSISRLVQKTFKVSKQTAHKYLSSLVLAGDLRPTGKGRGRAYHLNQPSNRSAVKTKRFQLKLSTARKLGEHELWTQNVIPLLPDVLGKNVKDILQHGFTEIVNNAIDHSQGSSLEFSYIEYQSDVELKIQDDGIGAFASLQGHFGLPNLIEAVAEIAKGKRTTMRESHAGEGIFFTSRAFDHFSLTANKLKYIYISSKDDWTIEEVEPDLSGTIVQMVIAKNSTKQLDKIYAQYTSSEDLAFDIGGRFNVKPYTIAASHDLVSRSEAKRLLQGAEAFREIVLDLKNVDRVGQAFVDEVFRVWANQHPETKIVPINMKTNVEFMIKRGLAHKIKN